jgi:hypothetical protein
MTREALAPLLNRLDGFGSAVTVEWVSTGYGLGQSAKYIPMNPRSLGFTVTDVGDGDVWFGIDGMQVIDSLDMVAVGQGIYWASDLAFNIASFGAIKRGMGIWGHGFGVIHFPASEEERRQLLQGRWRVVREWLPWQEQEPRAGGDRALG